MARVNKTATKSASPAKSAAPRRVAPVVKTKIVADTQELEQAKEGTTQFTPDNEKIEDGVVEITGNLVDFNEKAAALSFLEEKITIILNDADDNSKEPMVFCQVNGVGPGPGGVPWLPRNQPITIARKYIEVLAKARPVRVKSVEKTNNQGERYMEYPKSTKQNYPFQVIEDKNPRGGEWIRNLMMRRAG